VKKLNWDASSIIEFREGKTTRFRLTEKGQMARKVQSDKKNQNRLPKRVMGKLSEGMWP